ncbi:hypothetical protein [Erythrobacter sp. A6_0]|uniref:hypothetical protein n=1 Tax=Erythrobacter sp. A6_0 TaxID=2821089 RepID=UPI001ADA69D8|nr:hypothetical protein [Erythrobacter sp. A6_0]MBO9510925.1 hypothetical protein [Erythrobacter sp. A6_0]
MGRGLLRVYAMARPARSAIEGELVAAAAGEIGVKGSKLAKARAVARRVAVLALADLRDLGNDPVPALRRVEVSIATPCLANLAACPDLDAAGMVRAEAVRRFEANGCQWLAPADRENADREVVEAVAARLTERFRRPQK